MNNKSKVNTLAALLALAITVPSPTQAAESADHAKETRAKIDAAREESAKIRNQVRLTLEELNRMTVASVELRPQLEKYAGELAKMEEQAKIARTRVLSMKEKGQAYFQAWEEQIASIANPEIRELAQKRYNKRGKSYMKIITAMTEARDQMIPFLSDLNDIKTMLDSELSRGSVNSAKKLIKSANLHGGDVAEALVDVETELDRVSAELAKYQ